MRCGMNNLVHYSQHVFLFACIYSMYVECTVCMDIYQAACSIDNRLRKYINVCMYVCMYVCMRYLVLVEARYVREAFVAMLAQKSRSMGLTELFPALAHNA